MIQQSRIEHQKATAVSNFRPIFQELYTEIEPGAYLVADEILTVYKNDYETRMMVTFKQCG